MTVYMAIFQDDKQTVCIEYIPLEDGAIEIVTVTVTPRPRSAWQERAEAMLPVTRIEENILR